MNLPELPMAVALVIAICSSLYAAGQRVERLRSDADADHATRRAEAVERTIARDLHLRGCTCQPNPALERAFDQALEAAEPTPDLRRVK